MKYEEQFDMNAPQLNEVGHSSTGTFLHGTITRYISVKGLFKPYLRYSKCSDFHFSLMRRASQNHYGCVLQQKYLSVI